jgi:hypothetical protein
MGQMLQRRLMLDGAGCCTVFNGLKGQLDTSCHARESPASRPQMHRCRSGQRRQYKENEAGPLGQYRNDEEPYAVPAGRSLDRKGDADDEEQRRQEHLKQEKEYASFAFTHLCSPRKPTGDLTRQSEPDDWSGRQQLPCMLPRSARSAVT